MQSAGYLSAWTSSHISGFHSCASHSTRRKSIMGCTLSGIREVASNTLEGRFVAAIDYSSDSAIIFADSLRTFVSTTRAMATSCVAATPTNTSPSPTTERERYSSITLRLGIVPSTSASVCAPFRPMRPNQALERTADRRENLLSMISPLNPEAHLALVSGRSAYSR